MPTIFKQQTDPPLCNGRI